MALNSAQSIFNLIRVRASKEYQDFALWINHRNNQGLNLVYLQSKFHYFQKRVLISY